MVDKTTDTNAGGDTIRYAHIYEKDVLNVCISRDTHKLVLKLVDKIGVCADSILYVLLEKELKTLENKGGSD